MHLKEYLENRIKGWLPNEPDSPDFCRAADRENMRIGIRETSTFRYLMFFVIAVFLRLVSLPFLSRTEIVDIPLVLVAIAAVAFLIAVICETRTGRTSKWTKLSSGVAVDLGLGFVIYAVAATFVYLVGQAVLEALLLLVVFSYTVAFIIGIRVSKRMQHQWVARS
jgi:predicted permease